MDPITQLVPDLERLSSLETMYLRRLKLRYTGDKDFMVFSDTEELYHLRELEEELSSVKGRVGPSQPWYIVDALIPTTGKQVFRIRRLWTTINFRLEVLINDNMLTNVVRPKASFFKRLIHINNPDDELVLRVKGPPARENYVLQTKDKVTIGSIFKVTCHSPEELLPHLDEYVIKVPADMDVDLKLGVIATCYYLDILP